MKGTLAVLRKELLGSFNSPVAYVVLSAFLVFTSVWFFFIHDFFAADVASLRSYYGIMPIVFVVLIPAVTMRTWAEERAAGTDEILLTLPVGEASLVLGKYLASLSLMLLAVVLTIFVPLSVRELGQFEPGEIYGQYIGLVLLVTAGTAVGGLVSSLSRHQISAFVGTALILLFLTLAAELNAVLELAAVPAAVLRFLSFDHRFRNLNRGVLDTRDLAYFAGLTVAALYLTRAALVARKAR